MGSVCFVKFLNIGRAGLNGFIEKYELNQDVKEQKFNVKPGQDFVINLKFNGFCYYSLSIHEDEGERRSNYFEIRSIADFIFIQKALMNGYDLKIVEGRPNYQDFI